MEKTKFKKCWNFYRKKKEKEKERKLPAVIVAGFQD